MKKTAEPSKTVSKTPVEEMKFLDLATSGLLELLQVHNKNHEKFEPHMVFRYMVDCEKHCGGYDGEHVMDQNLMFFGLENCRPCENSEEVAYFYKAAQEIVERLSRGECIYPGAGCEIRMFVKGRYDNLKVVATLLNGWKNWQFEAKNNCTYDELKWTIEELNFLGMMPHEAV